MYLMAPIEIEFFIIVSGLVGGFSECVLDLRKPTM